MTHNKLVLALFAVAALGLAGCNNAGDRAQGNFDSAGHAIGNAASDTGQGFKNGAQATGQAIGTGAQRTGNAINNTVNGR